MLILSKIVSFVNTFCNLLIANKMKPTEGLKAMLSNQEVVTKYDALVIENFCKTFVDPDKIKRAFDNKKVV